MYWQISSSQDEPSLQWWLQQWNQKTVASWQESYDKPRQCVEKQRHFSADKGLYSHGCGLPSRHVWLSELDHKEGREPKSVAFELQCWWRLLKVPWTARRSNQSILREIYPEYLLEGLMLNLKVYYIGHLMWIDDWLEKSLMLRMIEGRRRWQRMRWLDGHHQCNGHELGQTSEDGEGQRGMVCCSPWGCRYNWANEQQLSLEIKQSQGE